MGQLELASALTMDCHTDAASMVTPKNTVQHSTVSVDKEVPIKFWKSYPDPESGYLLPIWNRFALAEVCALRVLVF